jgi:hypothetical protein
VASLHFEERHLKPFAEPVSAGELKENEVYFAVQYVDRAMLLPVVETLVFIGLNLSPGDSETAYFQTIDSYQQGIRYKSASKDEWMSFRNQAADQLNHIFTYESALNELMRCSLRRRGRTGQ